MALITPRYHVGSFDDDASYILSAKGLLAGKGLTSQLLSGVSTIGLYPPGYSALLAPLLWIWPHSFVPLRLLSAVSYAAVFPLLWLYLGRHGVRPAIRTVVLFVLALGPPFATYATMVMAETPFLVILMLLLLALDTWKNQVRALTRAGLAVVVLAALMVWFKQAGVGMVAGLIIWWPFSGAPRRWAKGALVAGGVGLALAPVVALRLANHIPLAGARYSQELGGFYRGGLVKRLSDVVPSSTLHLFSTAIPATLVPYLEPLPLGGHLPDLWKVLSWHVTIFIAIGAYVWLRRYRDATVVMTLVYLAESVLWPFVNERRAILLLPLLATWYVTGAAAVWNRLKVRAGQQKALRPAATALVALVAFIPLLAQAPRDYLFGWDQSSSRYEGSRYVAILRNLGTPADVLETDYRSSTALFTGHATNWTAFTDNLGGFCYGATIPGELASDDAGFILFGDLNKPGQIDNPCLQSQVALSTWAVQILHTSRDDASVYEVIGPGTAHPALTDVLDPSHAATTTTGGIQTGSQTTVSWSLPGPTRISQLTVGQAQATGTPTKGVRLQVERPDGTWSTVAAASTGVGDGAGQAPFLLADAVAGAVVGVRVVVDGEGGGAGATVTDVVGLGPTGQPTTTSSG